MILFGCLVATAIAFAPRIMLVLAWIFGDRWNAVWQGNWIAPLLGIIFAPYTTVMYMLVWSPTGIAGWDWMWIGLGVILDIMKWQQVAANRKGIPSQESTAQPAAQEVTSTTPAEPAPEQSADQSELDGLEKLRDEGAITEEEYEAKKAQLEGD